MSTFTHFDADGASRMVDTSEKPVTVRQARASAVVRMSPSTLAAIRDKKVAKGDVFEVARLAGIMAAKQTPNLIPLCHPLQISSVAVGFLPVGDDAVRIEATVKVIANTGVEMEALTAVTVAALTVYDMCKSTDRGMTIEHVRLEEKTGGKSGTYLREAP